MDKENNSSEKKERLPSGFVDRVEKILHEKCMSKNEFIRRAGLNSNVFSDWRNKASYPVSNTMLRIAKTLETSIEYLLEGRDDRIVVIGGDNDSKTGTFIPVLSNDLFNTKSSVWIPSPEWLESIPGTKICVKVTGDYMEPTIINGSLVICTETNSISSDGLYAVNLNGQTSIKRLSMTPIGINVSSDNSKYPVWTIEHGSKADFSIVGRVLAILSRVA